MSCCCCNTSHEDKRIERDENGFIVRLNLAFYTEGYCGPCQPLDEAEMSHVPTELFERGISEMQWLEWVQKLREVNNLRSGAFACSCLCWWSCVLSCPCLWSYLCKSAKEYVMAWNEKLLAWQNNFNSQVLENKDIFIKTRSYSFSTYSQTAESGTQRQRHAIRWFAIALTPGEILKLKEEPHLTGEIDEGCCGGPNEYECCIHP